MKKCPACDKTFDDSMRFCQIDGTPLVDDAPAVEEAPAFDPFATIVGVAPPKAEPASQQPEAPFAAQPEEAEAVDEPGEVLELESSDPLKTMYVSDEEMQSALKGDDASAVSQEIELQPIDDEPDTQAEPEPEPEPEAEPISFEPPAPEPEPASSKPEPEPPSFNVPNVPAPNFGDISPPPSPFSTGSAEDRPVSAPSFEDPGAAPPAFNEAETVIQAGYPNPFESEQQPPAPVAEWTPPPAPEPSWENQQVGTNTPFQPPAAEAAGQNKTLPIISLVLGILSLCCYVSPVTGLAAVITGFMGMKNANNSPNEYGGKGLAIAGMVIGGLMLLIGLAYWIFLLFFGGMAMIMDAAR